jgi:hypothetical protein
MTDLAATVALPPPTLHKFDVLIPGQGVARR